MGKAIVHLASGCLVACMLHVSLADACGPTPTQAEPLLPRENATGVPLNAALISSSNISDARFELRVAGLVLDAGSTVAELDVATECHRGLGGAVCVGTAELAPDTSYEYRVLPTGPGIDSEQVVWRSFSTGGELWVAGEPPAISVDVLENDIFEAGSCGIDSFSKLGVMGTGVDAPWVVNVAGFAPTYLTHAQDLGDGDATIDLWSPPSCVQLELYDQAGTRYLSPEELCMDDVLAPTLVAEDGTRYPASEDDPEEEKEDLRFPEPTTRAVDDEPESGGCGVARPTQVRFSGAGWLLAAAFFLRRRRPV